MVRFLLGITSTTAPFTDAIIDALLNLSYHDFVNEILKSSSDIDFNMVTEEVDLVKDAQTIAIAGKVLKIKRVEIKMDGTNWKKATFFDLGERLKESDSNSLSDFSVENPFVDFYTATGEALKADLYPIPPSAVTNGFKIWKTLEITELSGTSDEPSIAEAYQKYLAYGATEDFATRSGNNELLARMRVEKQNVLDKAIQFYSNRNEDIKHGLKPAFVDYE